MLILVVITNMIVIIFLNLRTLSSDCNVNLLLLAVFIIKIFIIAIKMSIIRKIIIIIIVNNSNDFKDDKDSVRPQWSDM